MSNTKEPLSQKSNKIEEEYQYEVIEEDENIMWTFAIRQGLYLGVITLFTLVIIALIINFVLFSNVLLVFLGDLVFLIAASFFLSSGWIIWFGPSPQWSIIKKSVTKRNVTPLSTSESLTIGISRSVTALFLLVVVFVLDS